MPKTIHGKLKEPKRIVAFDVETHGWPPGPSRSTLGEFGWHLRAEDGLLDFAGQLAALMCAGPSNAWVKRQPHLASARYVQCGLKRNQGIAACSGA